MNPPTNPLQEPVHPLSPPDELLAFFVGLANTTGVGSPVTLLVRGVLVSGNLISGKAFWQRVGEVIETAIGGPDPDEDPGSSISATFKKVGQDIYREGAKEPLGFIHLEGVRFIVPGNQALTTPRGLDAWRGRLDSVDGWFIGRLDPATSPATR